MCREFSYRNLQFNANRYAKSWFRHNTMINQCVMFPEVNPAQGVV